MQILMLDCEVLRIAFQSDSRAVQLGLNIETQFLGLCLFSFPSIRKMIGFGLKSRAHFMRLRLVTLPLPVSYNESV